MELSTSTHIDAAFTDKPKQRDRIKISFEGSGKSSQAPGAIEEVAAIANEMARVDVRRGEQWRWMVAIKMSKAPVVVAGNCVDAIERQSVGMGVHKTKKFFSLQRKTINSDGCG